ncbi:MAG: RNHCP domain-containing protein [Mycobacterium sp.]|nr:RNHCP domain-containing protein [Mycobacterium sp.]
MLEAKRKDSQNTGFACWNCGVDVVPLINGSYRNHCPACLYSRHVDIEPGDRASDCGGLMPPVGLRSSSKKGWQIVHRCVSCRAVRANRVAVDADQPDDLGALIGLSGR